jgi:3-deoxy-D-manno-octulosonic acid (KDO) 8-phosphate synthase
MTQVTIRDVIVGNDRPLTVIAGPCQLESQTHAEMIAGKMKEACAALGAQFIFKASYDKANRTSLSGKRGLGIEEGLKVLQSVGKSLDVPVLTDVHTEAQCAIAAEAVDVPPSCAARPISCWPQATPAKWSMSKRASSLRLGTWPISCRKSKAPETTISC